MVLIAELAKVSLITNTSNLPLFCLQILFFTAIEFFLLLYAGFVVINLIQSMIRTLICSVFLHRFLVMMD